MKRKIIAIAMMMVFALNLMSMNTYALDTQSVDVSYQIEYGYTINIPSSANMSGGAPLEISASDVLIGEEEAVVVSLDVISTSMQNNALVLTNDQGMSCSFNLYKQDYDGENKSQVTVENKTLALFKAGDTQAYSGGSVTLSPNITGGITAGNYSGTLHFIIETMEQSQLTS